MLGESWEKEPAVALELFCVSQRFLGESGSKMVVIGCFLPRKQYSYSVVSNNVGHDSKEGCAVWWPFTLSLALTRMHIRP